MTDNEKYMIMNAVKDAQTEFLTAARYGCNQLEIELRRRIYTALYNLLTSLDLDEEYDCWEWGEEETEESP